MQPQLRRPLNVTVANRAKLIVPTGFRNYDVCLNSYVGCQFGCRYCYVRWLVKTPDYDWGEFVRVRAHVEDKLPKELATGHVNIPIGKIPKTDANGEPVLKNGKPQFRTQYKALPIEETRLVIGTMTDPYQPQEGKHRVTRAALDILLANKPQLKKVGIFTRSPIVLDDLERIQKLPQARVHFTVTPYSQEILRKIEPIPIPTERRFRTIQALAAAGIRMQVNVAPALPIISDPFTDEFAERLAELQVAEYFVDPLQAYKESWEAIDATMTGDQVWAEVREVVQDKEMFQEWKDAYRDAWQRAWRRVAHKSPKTLAIWSDHIHHVWTNLLTGEQMDFKRYGDDLETT